MWPKAGQKPPEGGCSRVNPKAPARVKSAALWAHCSEGVWASAAPLAGKRPGLDTRVRGQTARADHQPQCREAVDGHGRGRGVLQFSQRSDVTSTVTPSPGLDTQPGQSMRPNACWQGSQSRPPGCI